MATERSGDWILLRVAGDIDLFSGAVIRERVHEQVADGCHLLVLDLTGVRFCDSSGVGVLIAARRLLRSCGGLLRLVLPDVPPDGGQPPVSAHVHRVFTALGVRRLFDIHPDVDSAIVGEPGRGPDPEADPGAGPGPAPEPARRPGREAGRRRAGEADPARPLGAVPGQDPGPDPAAERLSA